MLVSVCHACCGSVRTLAVMGHACCGSVRTLAGNRATRVAVSPRPGSRDMLVSVCHACCGSVRTLAVWGHACGGSVRTRAVSRGWRCVEATCVAVRSAPWLAPCGLSHAGLGWPRVSRRHSCPRLSGGAWGNRLSSHDPGCGHHHPELPFVLLRAGFCPLHPGGLHVFLGRRVAVAFRG